MSQFHVKLFLVLLKCNTLIKLWRVWKIGKLVVFSVSPIPFAVTKQVEGVGHMAAHLQQKSPFYFQKLPHTLIQCEPRQRVNHKAYQYSAVFGEKQKVSDQLHLRKVPSVYSTCFKVFFFLQLFVILFRDTVDNCILDFTPRMLYKFSWLPAFWELFLEALTSLLLTLHVA